MRAAIIRAVLLPALTALLGLGSSSAPASAQDGDYQASVITRTEVTANTPVCRGQRVVATATVTSDLPGSDPEGTVTFTFDGQQFAEAAVTGDPVTARVPQRYLTNGTHTLHAAFTPASGSNWQPSEDSSTVRVTSPCESSVAGGGTVGQGGAAGQGGQGGMDSQGGVLPGTGGVWLGLLAIAALLLGLGTYLVRRSRRIARRRRRTRDFGPDELPGQLSF